MIRAKAEDVVLFVDDEDSVLRSLTRSFNSSEHSFKISTATSVKDAIEKCRSHLPAVCVIDLELENSKGTESGFTLITELLKINSQIRIIVLTGHASEEMGIKSLNLGAATFLSKPANISHLSALIKDNISIYNLRKKYFNLVNSANVNIKGLKSCNELMKKTLADVAFIASTSQPTLILGETGVGKGVIAEAIHGLSKYSSGNFVRFQANHEQQDLIASELFGHTKGAFTGANDSRVGLIEEAHEGSLFIDEIGDLPEKIQLMLLHVLQEKKFRELGSNLEKYSNFRLISATNKSEEELKKNLRSDFYHRIARFSISLPKLKDRTEDISLLASDFLKKITHKENLAVYDFSPSALSWLNNYDWPGNIRELEAKVEIAAQRAAYHKRSRVEVGDFERNSPSAELVNEQNKTFHDVVRGFKYNYIKQALKENNNNKTKTAEALSIQRSTLCNILKEHKPSQHTN